MESDHIVNIQDLFYQTHDYTGDWKDDRILVLGIGNFLMGDEGVGVHVVHALNNRNLPKNTDIIDGGTGSFDLMPILSQYARVLFIDATMDGKPPGSINVLYPKFAKDFPKVLSAHDVGLKDMIDALEFQGELPKIILLTITISEIIPMTTKLSKYVNESVPKAVERVLEILRKITVKPE